MRIHALMLSLLAAVTLAAQESNQIVVGEWIPGVGRALACDTQEQIADIVTAHRSKGIDAAQEVLDRYTHTPGSGGRACGMVSGRFMVTSVFWRGDIQGDPASIVELVLVLPDGTILTHPLYSVFFNVEVVEEAGQKL